MKVRSALGALRTARSEARSTRRTVHRRIWEQAPPPPSSFAAFGDGAWLVPPLRIEGSERVSVGAGTVVLEHLELTAVDGARVTIGPGVRLGRFVTITSAVSVSIGPHVSSSDGLSITDGWGPAGRALALPHPAAEPVVVEEGAYLGANCTIGPGVTIGRGAFVGEGAVVFEDVPSFSVVYGNPAVVVRRYDGEGHWSGRRFP